ncbi:MULTISPECIES: hypothetical protein [Burkholderia]|uniref:Uncharacterized protein n=1 Tax=Burkholderia anthina TaxID=179879 RepID=A0A6P2G860_9BURK|nr:MULTISPECIES: hypothetical protein [Burkholderia]AXK62826.1 hypothetical protein DCN14_09295 [Burkholderia sp. IDO3]MBM2770374.1 hypothetical protein [Burkholderia anthina]PCD63493.1 hypothetical protein CN645_03750 [Burkholderia sp. IDO3]QTD92063.1 hypothetical protein J4G50_27865 [Burkholderia anthina]VVU49747.1 hypothetical protein BAN20980_02454 [Burkholderia anthina]
MTIKLSQYCRKTIYRTIWLFPEDYIGVYLHAENRGSACRKLAILSDCILNHSTESLDIASVYSYEELVAAGVSEDPDLRIFEMSRRSSRVIRWVERPLFLSVDQSLLGKWVSLNVGRAMSAAMGLKR